jgi:ribosomal protein S18 acetylase RimI-like enzyme
MAPAEVEAVAALHRRCFPDYRSTRLGEAYCRRMLRAYASRPEAWVSVAVDGPRRVVGYLVAAPPATQRAVDRALLPWAALCSLWRPGALVRDLGAVARRLRRLLRGGHASAGRSIPPGEIQGTAPEATVRLVLVGVSPSARGRGVVDALLHSFAAMARGRGHGTADLSVAPDNHAAHRAYARNGWAPSSHDSAHFRLDLDGPPSG